MTVRAKMHCVSIGKVCYSPGPNAKANTQEVVKLAAATGPDNESWAKWTPSGSLELSITNPEAVSQFEVGKFYFVDINLADE